MLQARRLAVEYVVAVDDTLNKKKHPETRNSVFLLFASVFIRLERSYLCSGSETKGRIILVLYRVYYFTPRNNVYSSGTQHLCTSKMGRVERITASYLGIPGFKLGPGNGYPDRGFS
jgi:hypothetical protein